MEELLLEKEREIETRPPDFARLYKELFPKVARYIGGKGGTLAEAKDVFQDALILYFERTTSQPGRLQKGAKEYIFGIAKNLWIDKFRTNNKTLPLEPNIAYEKIAEDGIVGKVNTAMLLQFLEQAGQKCMDMLQSFYYQKVPLVDIASRFGFSGTRSATVQKYKCIEKVRDVIKEKSLDYEDFLE